MNFNIDDLTIKQAKELSSLFNTKESAMPTTTAAHPYQIGKSYIIRTVTMIFTGRLVAVFDNELVLDNATWVAETAQYSEFIKTGEVREFESYPTEAQVPVGRGSLIDAVAVQWERPFVKK